MSLHKLGTHIILQLLQAYTLPKILQLCWVFITTQLGAFASLKHCRFPEQAKLLWAISLPLASSLCLILTSGPFWTPLPRLCLWLTRAFCSSSLMAFCSSTAGATSTSIPAVLFAPSSILVFAWEASGLCSFLDISSQCCPREMHSLSYQVLTEIHFTNLFVCHIKKPLQRYSYLPFLNLSYCFISHQQVFFI